jgi:hypothetical protein
MRPKMTKIFLDQKSSQKGCQRVLYANRHTWRCWEMCSHNFGQNLNISLRRCRFKNEVFGTGEVNNEQSRRFWLFGQILAG